MTSGMSQEKAAFLSAFRYDYTVVTTVIHNRKDEKVLCKTIVTSFWCPNMHSFRSSLVLRS